MPIIDRQRRLMEVGRIRAGAKKVTRGGKEYPAALTNWRLTSRVKERLDAAAGIYGGTVTAWDDQWELLTKSNFLDVMVAPGDSFSLWYEMWTGGGCQRRCDGETETIADKPCMCDPEHRMCKETLRVNLILPHLPGVGVWRLETHGYYASVELTAAIELVQSLGGNIMCKLRLEERETKRGGETKKFVVPTLDVEVAPLALMGGGEAPMVKHVGSYTPLPAPKPIPVERALEIVNADPPKAAPRSRAQVPFGESVPPPPPSVFVADAEILTSTPVTVVEAKGPVNPIIPDAKPISDAQRKRLFAIGRERMIPEAELRRIVLEVTGDESTAGITRDNYDTVIAAVQTWDPIPFGGDAA